MEHDASDGPKGQREGHAPAVNLHLSDGAEAEQDISHVHMPVVPRHSDDAGLPRVGGDEVRHTAAEAGESSR